MDWQGREESDNLEDGESESAGGGGGGLGFGNIFGGGIFGGGGLGGGGFGGGGFRFGGILFLIIIIGSFLFGRNPLSLLSGLVGGDATTATQAPLNRQYEPPIDALNAPPSSGSSDRPSKKQTDPGKKFIAVVLRDNEKVWDSLFRVMGRTYEKPKLHLFLNEIRSGCGEASSSSGPFYCPADRKVYLDRSFFNELSDRFQAPGDLAKTYVISHEIGHHVQNLLGTSEKMDRMRSQLSKKEYNKMSVKLELQADFYAGVFLHYEDVSQKVIHPGELESALKAASAVGDDRLQKAAQGYVVPDAFTHGTSAERSYWLKKGYDTGDITQGNTFAATSLDPGI